MHEDEQDRTVVNAVTDGEPCAGCGHDFGPHVFEATTGDPREGGTWHCQHYPDCPCAGTWDVMPVSLN